MKSKILLVDDEDSICNMVKLHFQTEGYLVYTALDAEEAVKALSNKPDLILLDINMPGVDGLEFCKRIRNHIDCPIIFLTSRITEQDKVVGLQVGGDDYITKPFGLAELTARVEAHLRRERRTRHSDIRMCGELFIDYAGRCVYCKEQIIPFSKKEFDIVEFLSVNTPITELQHKEFYEKDHVTGAFARYFCDSVSLVVLCLPAFVIIDLLLKDKRHKMRALIYPKTESSVKIICARFTASVCMIMLPIFILPLKSLITLINYCSSNSIHADLFAFTAYTFAWIFPTVLLIVAIGLFVTGLTENYSAVLFSGLIWLLGKPSVDKIAGGNYGLFDLIIRHNTLKGYGRMMENIQTLILNRVLISAAALVLVAFTVMIYDTKRKGGIAFESKKPFDNDCCKCSHEL